MLQILFEKFTITEKQFSHLIYRRVEQFHFGNERLLFRSNERKMAKLHLHTTDLKSKTLQQLHSPKWSVNSMQNDRAHTQDKEIRYTRSSANKKHRVNQFQRKPRANSPFGNPRDSTHWRDIKANKINPFQMQIVELN